MVGDIDNPKDLNNQSDIPANSESLSSKSDESVAPSEKLQEVDSNAVINATQTATESNDFKPNVPVESENSEADSSDSNANGTESESSSLDPDNLYKYIKSLVEELRKALENGQLRECISLYEQCQARLKKLDDIDYKPVSRKKLQKNLNELSFEIQNLKKWRNWGMNQARQGLIDQLIALKDSEEHPKDLHTKLKAIRDQWNKWNKTGDFPNQKLRESFSDAYNEAFAPCKAFFKNQKKQRKQNYKTRKKICADLESFYDSTDWGHNPDWEAIADAIRQSKNQWKAAVPLNKKDWDITNARFDEVISKFAPHLERECERGVQFRQELIRKANELDAQPIKVAIDKAKSYQVEWKTVAVRTRKKKENQLWMDFKSACDRQFQRRAEMHKERDKQRKKNTEQRQLLISEIKSVNQLSHAEIQESAARVSDIQRRWRQTSHSGKGKSDSLEAEFNNEVAKFKKLFKQAENLKLESLFQLLNSKAQICDLLERARYSTNSNSVVDESKLKWESISDNCGPFETRIQNRYSAACDMLGGDSADDTKFVVQTNENLEAKKSICLQLEVLADLDSPPAFAKERMQYNVMRLNEVMTKRVERSDPEDEIKKLLVEFWLTGPVPEEHFESINERFQRVHSALKCTANNK